MLGISLKMRKDYEDMAKTKDNDLRKTKMKSLKKWYISPLYARILAKIEVKVLKNNRKFQFVPKYHDFYP